MKIQLMHRLYNNVIIVEFYKFKLNRKSGFEKFLKSKLNSSKSFKSIRFTFISKKYFNYLDTFSCGRPGALRNKQIDKIVRRF